MRRRINISRMGYWGLRISEEALGGGVIEKEKESEYEKDTKNKTEGREEKAD